MSGVRLSFSKPDSSLLAEKDSPGSRTGNPVRHRKQSGLFQRHSSKGWTTRPTLLLGPPLRRKRMDFTYNRSASRGTPQLHQRWRPAAPRLRSREPLLNMAAPRPRVVSASLDLRESVAAAAMEASSGERLPTADLEPSGPPALFVLCGWAVSANMGVLESGVWALPGPILQGILPLLNIYYLERAEHTAQKKGLSTQAIWHQLWDDVMRTRPPRSESVPCWRTKFLETFFCHVLRGTLDPVCDWRLQDSRFSALQHSAPYVTQLTICNALQGVGELVAQAQQEVLQTLAHSLHTLKFRHLLFSDGAAHQALRKLLHRLIHHGVVQHVSMYSWPVPETALFILILTMSAGLWQPAPCDGPCSLCKEDSPAQASALNEPAFLLGPGWPHRDTAERSAAALMATRWESEAREAQEQAMLVQESRTLSEAGSGNPAAPSSGLRTTASSALQPQVAPRRKSPCLHPWQGQGTEPDDLYDFVFLIGSEREEQEEKQNPVPSGLWDLPSPDSAQRFRSISALELFTIPLSAESTRVLCHLLRSWVSLEKLTLSYNGLGSNIFHLLEGLQALSAQANCCLRSFHFTDLFSPLSVLELAHTTLRVLPRLRSLAIRIDHLSPDDSPRAPGNSSPGTGQEDIPENCLEQLELGFPRRPQASKCLCRVLEALPALQQLALDSATFTSPRELGLVLQTLRECNPALQKLSFHDMNLADCQKEVLLLFQDPTLQELTLSFCRLLEKRRTHFLPKLVTAMKSNSTLKSFRLPGNRLGSSGLMALAEIFSSDSSSSLCQLDISSNCIKPDGLLEFAKQLEQSHPSRGTFGHLCLFQNWLDQDPGIAQEAIGRLRATFSVVSDTWDSSQAFADYVGMM
ncbi:leucine-rich repeat-containing protein 41 [Trichosurus vulpecula]|uniref:leucine-rich repeat-containing protein 41 n=1 Tax=Trichosurus vulpecula TaxID=9337 RepID=UPI00186B4AC0|nr:leucine-rich repeat-containing protein 41 [Trichosurus vulpecula]